MKRSRARDYWIKQLIEYSGRGRPWFANKVALVMWPGRPGDFEKVFFSEFRCHLFATHLEAGIFLDTHKAGWSYVVVSAATPLMDITEMKL